MTSAGCNNCYEFPYCTCSQSEHFPQIDNMSPHSSHRGSMTSQDCLNPPSNIGLAFGHDSNQDMSNGMMPVVHDTSDPRTDPTDMFGFNSSQFASSAPSRANGFADPRPQANDMIRAQSFTNQHRPTVPSFMAQPGSADMSYLGRGGVVTGPTTYRPRAGPASYTSESTRSYGHQSHRSSFSNQYAPQTPASEFGGSALAEMHFDNQAYSGPYTDATPRGAYESQTQYSHSPTNDSYLQNHPVSPVGPSQGAPMSRNVSKSSAAERKRFWCDVQGCSHGRAFGTRNDLDRHKLAVHKLASPNSQTKVYICQGFSCVQQGKTKVWPRKDNFKNHCKVAHPEVDADDVVQRSERCMPSLETHEVDHLENEEPPPRTPSSTETATQNGNLSRPPSLRISLLPTSRKPEDTPNTIPPSPSSAHLSPLDNRRYSFSRTRMQRSPSASSVSTTTHASTHRRSLSSPHAPHMSRGQSDPTNNNLALVPSKRKAEATASLEDLRRLYPSAPPDLIEALSRHAIGTKRPRVDEEGNENRGHKCTFKDCAKTFKRPCDLKKHKIRHTKPWGCTDPDCYKEFGSKNDWKRHEHSRHFQLETWICGEAAANPVQRCTETFTRKNDFAAHLRDEHDMTDDELVAAKQKSQRVGRNWCSAFWCGFCRHVIPLKRKNQEAWDERFDHIDSHLFADKFQPGLDLKKLGARIAEIERQAFTLGEWVPPASVKCKAELRLETPQVKTKQEPCSSDGTDEESGDDSDSDQDADGDACMTQADHVDAAVAMVKKQPGAEPASSMLIDPKILAAQVRVEEVELWWCAGCGHGGMESRYYDSCTSCDCRRTGAEHTECRPL